MPKTAVTIRDVARVAGVSKSAVSSAFTGNGRISDETKALILEAAGKMGFEPNLNAQRLQNKRISDLIGLFSLDLDLSVGTRKIKLIRYLLETRGFNVQIHSCGYAVEATPREVRLLAQQRPRAIICHTTDLPDEALAELSAFQENGGILVCYDHPVDLKCDQVVFDRADNTYQAARHLLQQGHRRLGFFQLGVKHPSGERFNGFQTALREFGLEVRPEWLFQGGGMDEFEYYGVELAAQFLALKERPTALCIVNDYVALTFVAEVQRSGLRVPQDVAVVGHDDRPIARYSSVPLSSVSQPLEIIAENVVELLLARLTSDSELPFRREVVCGELTVRASSGPPAMLQ
jgi:DNA-binding LacI/PurR family transcriptional regulator